MKKKEDRQEDSGTEEKDKSSDSDGDLAEFKEEERGETAGTKNIFKIFEKARAFKLEKSMMKGAFNGNESYSELENSAFQVYKQTLDNESDLSFDSLGESGILVEGEDTHDDSII